MLLSVAGSTMSLITVTQNPSASATSDKPQCMCPGSCSQRYLVLCFLEGTVFLPRENLPPAGLWDTISGGGGGGRVGSLSQGHKPEGHGWEQIMAIASWGEKPYPF